MEGLACLYLYTDIIMSLSVLTGHFPGGRGFTRMSPFWTLLELRVMEVVSGGNRSYKTCKAPVKMSPSTNPSCRPTNSVRALKGKDIILSRDYNVTPTTRVFEAASSVAVALLADTAAAAAAVV